MIAWEEFVMFFFLALILIYIAAAGIYHFEHEAQPDRFTSIFDSLWWAICTLTTVGYGDVYPITAGGRVFTCMVLLIGLGIIAVPTGIIASSLTVVREHEHDAAAVSSQGKPPVN
jgi:voltage-gated potassium channel